MPPAMTVAASADLTQLLVLLASMAAAGAFAGFIAGLLGVGGGIVVVPAVFEALRILEMAPDHRMHVAVGTSLATIIATATRSARAHHLRGAVDANLLWSWGPAIFVGVALGSALSGIASGHVLTAIFGVVALIVAAYMSIFGNRSHIAQALPGQPFTSVLGVIVGLISSMMGIGGGTLSVPILSLCNYPIRYAVGTASAIGLLIAIPGAFGFVVAGWNAPDLPPFSIGFVNPLAFAAIAPTTILVAPLGARVAHALPHRVLRLLFAAFLCLTGSRMLAQTFGLSLFGG